MKNALLKKLMLFALVAIVSIFADDSTLPKAERIGPVSQYGELIAGQVKGKGRIYGSCKGVKAGQEIQLHGVSLFWSLISDATEFYSQQAITGMVKDLKIQIVRAPIATYEDWGGSHKGYILEKEPQLALLREVVHAAVKNDIYVIIDWHSHIAPEQGREARDFFETVAKEYGHLDNVIFEVFNEPTGQSWSDIKRYAERMLSVIRKYSDNLVLVGTPNWSQKPSAAIGREVQDPANNVAYSFHFYPATHRINKEGASAKQAIDAGLPLFISEWGTGKFDGKEPLSEADNRPWIKFIDDNKISTVNWSASRKDEQLSLFTPESDASHMVLTESGNFIKKRLSKNPSRYRACPDKKVSAAPAPAKK